MRLHLEYIVCDPDNPFEYPCMIYFLTAIGLTPSGISTVHIYTKTIHKTTQLTVEQRKLQLI